MSITKVDHWIGKTLFVPPIIKLCQLTRQSQFAVSKLFWFVAGLDGLYRADTLFMSVVWGVLCVFMLFTASMRADNPTMSHVFFRLLALGLLAFDILTGATTGNWAGCEFWILVLVAEYATTIRTIPPKDNSKATASAREAG